MTTDRLSNVDAAMVSIDTGPATVNVGWLARFDGECPTLDRLCERLARCTSKVPRLGQRLEPPRAHVGRPRWAKVHDFDVRQHVHRAEVPPGGGDAGLKQLVATIHASRLDRSRPLWEWWLIEGGEPGWFACYFKVHHCLADAVSGTYLLELLLDDAAQRDPVGPATRVVPPVRQGRIVSAMNGLRGLVDATTLVLGGTTRTPLNVEPGYPRELALVKAPLGRLKPTKDLLGATVNDLVLAVVAGAGHRYLPERGMTKSNMVMRAGVPVNWRLPGDELLLGNRVSVVGARLPVRTEDPQERVRAIHKLMSRLRRTQATGARLIGSLGRRVTAAGLKRAYKRAFNTLVSSVNGPPYPLFLLGNEAHELYFVANIQDGQSLVVTELTYNGSMYFAIIVDERSFSRLDRFEQHLEASIAELSELAPHMPGSSTQSRPRRLAAGSARR